MESGNFGENGRNGALSPKSPNCKQKFKLDGKGALWKVAILAKMAYLGKMAINRQNRQSVKKIQLRLQRGPLESGHFGENGVHQFCISGSGGH